MYFVYPKRKNSNKPKVPQLLRKQALKVEGWRLSPACHQACRVWPVGPGESLQLGGRQLGKDSASLTAPPTSPTCLGCLLRRFGDYAWYHV